MPNSLLNWLFHHVDNEYSAHKWAELIRVEIVDPDGWRHKGRMGELPLPPTSLDTEIGLTEFMWRLSSSTIHPLNDGD